MNFAAPGCQVRQMRNLLSLLYTVSPEVAEDPNLVERSLLVTGVTQGMSPRDLLHLFPGLRKDAAVVVRDYETGERAGLVVLASDRDCDKAINLTAPRLGGAVIFYRACIKARAWQEGSVLADAADDNARRKPMADVLQSLVPPLYVLEDKDSAIHLRCVFLVGAYSLSRVEETVPEPEGGDVCAVVTCKSKSVTVLVYDNAYTAGLVERSLVSKGVQIYDSSLFPFAGASAAAAVAEGRGMVPAYLDHPEYLGRVVTIQGFGFDTEHRDALLFAASIQDDRWSLESVIVHRHHGLVIAVFDSKQSALRMCRHDWIIASESDEDEDEDEEQDQQMFCEIIWGPKDFADAYLIYCPPEPERPLGDIHPKALEDVHEMLNMERRTCAAEDTNGIANLIMKLVVHSRPDPARYGVFPDRALLLLGIRHFSIFPHLWAALSYYGEPDYLCICNDKRAALVVFKSWVPAFTLLQQPTQTWLSIGFFECREVPGVEHAAQIDKDLWVLISKVDRIHHTMVAWRRHHKMQLGTTEA